MTDEERKELEATANWVMIPNEEVSNAVVNGIRWGVAPTVVRLISYKNEREIYNLLDYWYKFNNRLSRKQFAENVIHLIQHEKRDITQQQIEWINRWVNTDSTVDTDSTLEKAWCDDTIRKSFKNDKKDVEEFIQYCLNASSPAGMARKAVSMGVDSGWVNKKLHDALMRLGFDAGKYENWRKATSDERQKIEDEEDIKKRKTTITKI